MQHIEDILQPASSGILKHTVLFIYIYQPLVNGYARVSYIIVSHSVLSLCVHLKINHVGIITSLQAAARLEETSFFRHVRLIPFHVKKQQQNPT